MNKQQNDIYRGNCYTGLFSCSTGPRTGTDVIIANSLYACHKMFVFDALKSVKENQQRPAYLLHRTSSYMNNIPA